MSKYDNLFIASVVNHDTLADDEQTLTPREQYETEYRLIRIYTTMHQIADKTTYTTHDKIWKHLNQKACRNALKSYNAKFTHDYFSYPLRFRQKLLQNLRYELFGSLIIDGTHYQQQRAIN